MKLGENSTTGDEEGEKTALNDKQPLENEVSQALAHYIGDIMQTPPIFSAIKVNGVRSYKLAREGKPVVLEPRPAHIYQALLTNYDYPYANFTAQVSSGTYIRSLVEDLGKFLGTGAYMSGLERTQVGEFNLADAQIIDNLNEAILAQSLIE
jgi:tRNA pseudouridine55 synthase